MGKKKKQPGNTNSKEENRPINMAVTQLRSSQQIVPEEELRRSDGEVLQSPQTSPGISHRSLVRNNITACYMQMAPPEFQNAVRQCNLALEVTPNYSKALLKRARCYEGMNRLDLGFRDTAAVLDTEPNNDVAVEVAERVKKMLEERGLKVTTDAAIELPPNYIEPVSSSSSRKTKKKKGLKFKEEEKPIKNEETEEKIVERKAEDKAVVEEENVRNIEQEQCQRNVKLVFGEDIRWARIRDDCSLGHIREVVNEWFPGSGTVLVNVGSRQELWLR